MHKSLIIGAFLSSAALITNPVIAQVSEEDQAVVSYDRDYFVRYEPVTLLDMLQRVPGVQAILDANRQQGGSAGGGSSGTGLGSRQARGFGSGGDQILINNRRLSGKANNINDTLQRISAAQVERVEIIRGASSDLDVQSQGLVVNVVMDESASTSSTFWKVGGRYSETYDFSPDLLISHNGSSGNVDYIIGLEAKQGQHIEHRFDEVFTPDDVKTGESARNTDNVNKYLRFNANLTYATEGGDEIRLNGQFEPGKYRKREPRYSQDVGGPRNNRNWDEDQTSSKWEIGGDYTTSIDGIGTWKTLFIANRDRIDKTEILEDLLGGGDVPVFRNNQYRVKKEKILRSSITRNIFSDQTLELGGEMAINNFDKIFSNEDYVAGSYVVNVNDDVTVKENRYEIFANHTYNISPKIILQSSLIGEFSKISSVSVPLTGENIERSKNFSFLKPRADFRYDFDDRNQLRASVERKVSQLDFQNFVATFDASNDIVRLGNTGIVPEKSWNYSLTYEHRLPDDAGAFQVELFYRDITDYIGLVDFTEFFDAGGAPIAPADLVLVSRSGNIPTAEAYGIKATGSLRLGFLGVPDAVFSVSNTYEKTDVVDQFSGVNRPFKWKVDNELTFNFRHDVTDWGLSYGFKGTIKSDNSRHEINEIADTYNGDNYEAFAELQIWGDMKTIFKFEHITPLKYDTITRIYNGHIRFNDLSHYEHNTIKYVREWSIYLQGTF